MLRLYKTPSARVDIYPNVIPALNFSKIRESGQRKINHSLNKPLQESCPGWKSYYWLLILKIYNIHLVANSFTD